MSEHYQPTQYGFEWGAAKVQRLWSHDGTVMLEVETPKRTIQVYVTPSGKVRVFDSVGKEWAPPSKGKK